MLNTAVHRPWLRMLACILGELIAAFSLNCFIVPLGLYSGGGLGVLKTFTISRTLADAIVVYGRFNSLA